MSLSVLATDSLAHTIRQLSSELKPLDGRILLHPLKRCTNNNSSCSVLAVINRVGREGGVNLQARHYFDKEYIIVMRGPK
jgi:hypothetical protein